MSENKNNDRRSPAPDLEALTRAYEQSMNSPAPEVKKQAEEEKPEEPGGFVPKDYKPRAEATPEHDKIVDKIREDRRKRSHSVWTDKPLLKPKKSVWIDDEDTDSAPVGQAAQKSAAARPSAPVKRGADSDIIAPLPVMTEKSKKDTVQPHGQESELVRPLLDEKPRKQEIVINMGSKGDTQVRRMPTGVNKQSVVVDMSGYKQRTEPEEYPERQELPTPAESPVPEEEPVQAEPPKQEETLHKRTVSLQMPISKIVLDDLEPVVREDKQEEIADIPAEEDMSSDEDHEEEIVGIIPETEEAAEEVSDVTYEEEEAEETTEGVPEEDDIPEEEIYEEEYDTPAVIEEKIDEEEETAEEEYDDGEEIGEEESISESVESVVVDPKYIMPTRHNKGRKKLITHELEFRFINCIMCAGVVFTLFFSLLFMERESGFIDSENRELAEFPSFSVSDYFSGKYTKSISDYYTDTIAGREELKKFGSFFDRVKGIDLGGTRVSGTHKTAEKETLDEEKLAAITTVTANTAPVAAVVDGSTSTEKEELADLPDMLDDGVTEGNVIVFGKGSNVRAVSGYYGQFSTGADYARTINKYKEAMPDVNVYSMSIPLSSAYYIPDSFKDTVADQKDNIDNIASELKNVISVDVYDAIGSHRSEYIYSRTDHRWQPLGAYYAAEVFAGAAGVDHPELRTYQECSIRNFLGTMYAYSNYDIQLAAYPDTFIYYKPDNEYTTTYYDTDFTNGEEDDLFFDHAEGVNCYSAILGADDVIAEIETDVDNGRTLVIFKDSFGNALVPFLTHGFEKIYVCDIRYFDENAIAFCRKVGCTDLLFALSVNSCSSETHIAAINNNRIRETELSKALQEGALTSKTETTITTTTTTTKRKETTTTKLTETTSSESGATDESQPDDSSIPEYDDDELGG